jgi:hypothetical protein
LHPLVPAISTALDQKDRGWGGGIPPDFTLTHKSTSSVPTARRFEHLCLPSATLGRLFDGAPLTQRGRWIRFADRLVSDSGAGF